jgi:hypothetical protein
MRLTRLFAAGLTLALVGGVTAGAWAVCPVNQTPVSTGPAVVDPAYRGTVNVDIVDPGAENFTNRVRCDVVNKVPPHVGETRAAVEASYGPAQTALAPGKPYEIYTNEADLSAGRYFLRNISQQNLRVYEITYNNNGLLKSATDKVVDVKLRVIPRIGDHRNLVTKLLGDDEASIYRVDPQGEHVVYGIPRMRYIYYSDVLKSPFKDMNAFFSNDGFLVGQEFMTYRLPNQYVHTTAGRYVEHQAKWQPDRKIGW